MVFKTDQKADVVTTKCIDLMLSRAIIGACTSEKQPALKTAKSMTTGPTPKGRPRQRTVAWLGELDKAGRLGIEKYTKNNSESQQDLFNKSPDPEWVEVNVNGIRVEKIKDFGGP